MRRTRTTIAIALTALGIAAAPAAADVWREPDGGPNPINAHGESGLVAGQTNVSGPVMADVGGVPHVAWSEWNGTVFELRVARLEGGQWKQVGPLVNANPSRDAFAPSLAVNEGSLWITWLEDDHNGSPVVRVARLQGSAWVPIGGPADRYPSEAPGDNRFYAGQGQLVFKDGVPHLGVLEDNGVEFSFALMRLDANEKWAVAAGGSIGGRGFTITRGFDLETSGGRIYIDAGSFTGFGVVWRLATNGREWENVGLPPGAESANGLTDVAGVLHTLFSADGDGGTRRQAAARLVSGVWEQVGPDIATTPANAPQATLARSLEAIGGVPHVLLETGVTQESIERDLAVVRLAASGGAWEPVGGGAINNRRTIGFGRLVGVGSVPYVGWSEFDGCNYEVRVARVEPGTADDPPLPPPSGCKDIPPREGPGPTQPPGQGGVGPGGGPDPGTTPTPIPPVTGSCGVQLLGTQLSDALTGDDGRNEILGLGGNDRIWGGGHADCLSGGTGNDLVDGGAGNDVLHGEAGNDRLKGGADSDDLTGGAGNDRLTGGDDEDALTGGTGNDVLTSGDGFDTVSAGSGNDVIDARGAGFDRIDCGSGRDRVKNVTRRSDVLRGCEVVSYLRR
jgi:hypothetical protein